MKRLADVCEVACAVFLVIGLTALFAGVLIWMGFGLHVAVAAWPMAGFFGFASFVTVMLGRWAMKQAAKAAERE